MKKRSFLLAAATGVVLSVPATEVFRYDFGTPVSPVRQGFIQVTPKGGKGVRWSGDKIKARVNEIVEKKHNARRKSMEPPPVYFSDLSCDHVWGAGKTTLHLQVPKGKYHIYCVSGHQGQTNKSSFVFDTKVGGQRMVNWGPWAIRAVDFSAETGADGLKIDFETESNWIIDFLLAVPEKEWARYRKSEEFLELEREHFLLSFERLKKWKRIAPPIARPNPEPVWSSQQKKDGFALFSRIYCEPVWPEEFPAAAEINAPLRTFGAGEEYQTVTFSIHALKELNNVSLNVSALADGRGHQLAAPEMRYVKYMFVRPHYTVMDRYFEAPDIVMPYKKALNVEKNRNLRFWLTIQIPKNTAAGIYSGTVTLNADGTVKKIPLTVKVLPFNLPRETGKIYSIYYRYPGASGTKDSFSAKWLYQKGEYELADLKKNGFTGITGGFWAHRYSADNLFIMTSGYEALCKAIKRYGINAPVPCSYGEGRLYHDHVKKQIPAHLIGMEMPPESYFRDIEAVMKKIKEFHNQHPDWNEPLCYMTDEPDYSGVIVPYLKRIGEIAKKAGLRTYVTADPANPRMKPLFDVVDIWAPSQFTLTPEEIRAWQKKRPGTEFWCYPNSVCGSNNHVTTAGARMTFGFGFWKSEFKTLIPWMYQSIGGDQWNYLDAPRMDFLNRTDEDGSVIPAANYLCYREGIDDMRYIAALQNLIVKAEKQGGTAAAKKAESVLTELKNAIPWQRRYKDEEDGVWAGITMESWRWSLAQAIMNLQKELKK